MDENLATHRQRLAQGHRAHLNRNGRQEAQLAEAALLQVLVLLQERGPKPLELHRELRRELRREAVDVV